MRTMTRSPLKLARTTLALAQRRLPTYGSKYSRKDFTQAQLFTMLVMRQFFRLDYRGFTELLAEWSDLRKVLGLKKIPHHTTLVYAHRRLLEKGAFRRSSRGFSPLRVDAA